MLSIPNSLRLRLQVHVQVLDWTTLSTWGQIKNDHLIPPPRHDWVLQLPMMEFALNLSTNKSMGYTPFELSYGHMPQMTIKLPPTNLPGVEAFAQCTLDHLQGAHNTIIKSCIDQLTLANKHRWSDFPMLKLGESAYISTKNLSLPKGWVSKLLPKYIGPYEILEVFPDLSNYVLKLSPALEHRGIFPKFHVSQLAPHKPNDTLIFLGWAAWIFYDFGNDPEREY